MTVHGLDTVIISAGNLEESIAFYHNWFGMQVIARGDVEPDTVHRLYNLPPGTGARATFLKNRPVSTLVALIEFLPQTGRPIRGP